VRIESADGLKIGDKVLYYAGAYGPLSTYEVCAIKRGTSGPHMLRLFRVGTDQLQTAFWVNLADDAVYADLDSDEERQQIHEGGSQIMGPVYRLRVGSPENEPKPMLHVNPQGAGPAGEVLSEALQILAERGRRYDNEGLSPSITTTAELWQAYLEGHDDGPITEEDVCHMVALHKLARWLVDRAGRDHHLDMVNYVALAAAEARRRPAASKERLYTEEEVAEMRREWEDEL
jgi:hypothetical protein